jgi:hypothetical protein
MMEDLVDQRSVEKDLIARVMATAEAEDLRAIMGDAIRRRIYELDCGKIIDQAVQPIVSAMVKELLKDPEVQSQLQFRVRSELLRIVGEAKLDLSARRF